MPRTRASCFINGRAGEEYVRRHIQELLEHGFVGQQLNTAADNVEGGDSRIVYYRFGEEVDISDYFLDDMNEITGTGREIASIETGGLEVKTINSFTFRTNDNNEPTGTLPFELWNGDRYGWLIALLDPEIRLDGEDIHAVQPVLFCFLLVSYLGPYACVMFEDFPALTQRLNELAAEKGFQLNPLSEEHPLGVPAAADAEMWRQDDLYIIGNCWHVPFSRLSDLATVTLIGESPMVKHSIQLNDTDEYEQLQQARYDYLLRCAGERNVISAELRSETDFYPADETHLFADALRNARCIDNLSEDDYPFLFKALKSLGMRSHLKSVLYNMYSHLTISTVNGYQMWFLQGKSYLHEWSKEIGVKGSPFSWQSHLIFLTDTGLLIKFVDNSNPVNPKVYRSIPKYTDEVLCIAEQKAYDYLRLGIKLNNFTKPEVIKVSGQEKADVLYLGDYRKVSNMQNEIDATFVDVANRLFSQQTLLLPNEIVDIVREQIMGRYMIDIFDENPNSEQLKRYKQAQNELRRLEKRYEELSRDMQCQFRELTKEEKVAMDIPRNSRKKYFIR